MSTMKLRRALALCLLALPAVLLMGCAETDPLAGLLKDGYPLPSTITPPAGVVGTVVTIAGKQFGSPQGTGTLKIFCGPSGTAVNIAPMTWTDTEITFHMPAPDNATMMNAELLAELTNDAGKKCPWTFYVTILSTNPPAAQ